MLPRRGDAAGDDDADDDADDDDDADEESDNLRRDCMRAEIKTAAGGG